MFRECFSRLSFSFFFASQTKTNDKHTQTLNLFRVWKIIKSERMRDICERKKNVHRVDMEMRWDVRAKSEQEIRIFVLLGLQDNFPKLETTLASNSCCYKAKSSAYLTPTRKRFRVCEVSSMGKRKKRTTWWNTKRKTLMLSMKRLLLLLFCRWCHNCGHNFQTFLDLLFNVFKGKWEFS